MKTVLGLAGLALIVSAGGVVPAASQPGTSQPVSRVFTKFDSKQCKHTRGRAVEDYGSWRCKGYGGIDVVLSAGDQRMTVSFGRKAGNEPAASQTFPAFNNVYEGTVEWRLETLPNGKTRPFATILRWNVRQDPEERNSSGRVLVVTRLGAGKVCQVGYVDARANPNANELAQQIADEKARMFDCDKDKPVVVGTVSPNLTMPRQ